MWSYKCDNEEDTMHRPARGVEEWRQQAGAGWRRMAHTGRWCLGASLRPHPLTSTTQHTMTICTTAVNSDG